MFLRRLQNELYVCKQQSSTSNEFQPVGPATENELSANRVHLWYNVVLMQPGKNSSQGEFQVSLGELGIAVSALTLLVGWQEGHPA